MTAAAANDSLARRTTSRRCAFAVAMAGLVAVTDAIFAQGASPNPPAPTDATVPAEQKPATASIEDVIKKHEQELEQARAKQRDAVEAETKLKAEIAALGQ